MNNNLTVVVLTKNEEKNIVAVVQNAKKIAAEVLIVDSGSTDKTVQLAEENGAKVVYRAWDNDFAAQRNFALQHVKTEWVLYLDADERMTDDLLASVKNAVGHDKTCQYSIKRKSVAFGQELNYGSLKPDFVPRLFKTKNVKWINKVHEKPVCADQLKILNGYIRHYTYNSWEQWLAKFNQYTTIWAEDAFNNKKKSTYLTAFLHAFFGFWQMLIVKKGICDGALGIILCFMHFFYTLTKYLKLIDLYRTNTKHGV